MDRANSHCHRTKSKRTFSHIPTTKLIIKKYFKHNPNVALEQNVTIMATQTSNDDDDSVRSDSSEANDDDDSAAGDLQTFLENDQNVLPAEKIPFVISLCFAYIKGFSTDVAPYNDKAFKNSKKNHKISKRFLQKELKRRDSSSKLSNKKQDVLLQMLTNELPDLPTKDLDFLKRQEANYKAHCQATVDETAATESAASPSPNVTAGRGPKVTLDDRLCLIEALLSDEGKQKMVTSQDCLTREQIDAHNSVLAVEDYFETMSRIFIDPTFVPRLSS